MIGSDWMQRLMQVSLFEAQYISVLNVAGPRESKYPGGIYSEAFSYLERVFLKLKESV